MDAEFIKAEIEKKVPGSVLAVRLFGRSSVSSIWIDSKSLVPVAKFIAQGLDPKFEELEDFSVVQVEQAFLMNYFLRSRRHGQGGSIDLSSKLIIRVSIDVEGSGVVSYPSVGNIWPMIQMLELEQGDLFGIQFEGLDCKNLLIPSERPLLASNWKGFPLRKGYRFPSEFEGVRHDSRV